MTEDLKSETPPRLPKPVRSRAWLVPIFILVIIAALIPLGILFHSLVSERLRSSSQPPVDRPDESAPATNPVVSDDTPIPEPALTAAVETAESTTPAPEPEPEPVPAIRPGYEAFADALGYYRLIIPSGCSPVDASQGSRSKSILQYGSNLEVILIADESSKTTWNPQSEMNRKLESIRDGQAGILSSMRIQSYGLVAFGVIKGYEIALTTKNTVVHTYSLYGNRRMLSLSMEAKNSRGLEMSEKFREAFQKTVELYEPGSSADNAGSEDWAKARQTVKIQGIVQSGGKNALLINNRIVGQGEIIRTLYQGREFKFLVQSIGNEQYDVRLEPIEP